MVKVSRGVDSAGPVTPDNKATNCLAPRYRTTHARAFGRFHMWRVSIMRCCAFARSTKVRGRWHMPCHRLYWACTELKNASLQPWCVPTLAHSHEYIALVAMTAFRQALDVGILKPRVLGMFHSS